MPNLSLISPTQALAAANNRRPAEVVAATLPNNRAAIDTYSNTRTAPANAFNTLPGGASSTAQTSVAKESAYGTPGRTDDFGVIKPAVSSTSNGSATAAPSVSAQPTSAPASSGSPRRRPNSAGGGNRFTITNAQPQEIPQDNVSRQRSTQAAGPGANSAQKSYPTAEQEKKLYEQAIAKVAKVQV